MGQHGYVVTNALAGLAAGSFTWNTGSTTDRDKLNDGRMDVRALAGTHTSPITLVVDMGAATSLVGWGALNSNFAGALSAHTPQLKIEGADDASITVNVVTAKAASTLYTATSPRNKDHVLQFPAVSKRYWRLTWSWSGGGSSGAIYVGELFAYSAINMLSRRSVYGSGEQQDWITAPLQMMYGETRSAYLAGPVRQLNYDWADLTSSQRDELQAMYASTNGGTVPLLWVMSYETQSGAAAVSEQECIYGRLAKPSFGWKESDFSLFQPDGMSLRSLGREAGA